MRLFESWLNVAVPRSDDVRCPNFFQFMPISNCQQIPHTPILYTRLWTSPHSTELLAQDPFHAVVTDAHECSNVLNGSRLYLKHKLIVSTLVSLKTALKLYNRYDRITDLGYKGISLRVILGDVPQIWSRPTLRAALRSRSLTASSHLQHDGW
jgi:hypothetical protein